MTAPMSPAVGAPLPQAPGGGPHNVGRAGEGEAPGPADSTLDWLAVEMDRQYRAGIPNLDNVGGGVVDVDRDDEDDLEPHPYVCPTCSGNGCRVCGDTGELVEWTR